MMRNVEPWRANLVGFTGFCDGVIDIGSNSGFVLSPTYGFGQTGIVDHLQHGLVPFSGNGIEDRCIVIEDHHRLAAAFVKGTYWVFFEVSQRCGGIGQYSAGLGLGRFDKECFT